MVGIIERVSFTITGSTDCELYFCFLLYGIICNINEKLQNREAAWLFEYPRLRAIFLNNKIIMKIDDNISLLC
jgi:hypothetical protein